VWRASSASAHFQLHARPRQGHDAGLAVDVLPARPQRAGRQCTQRGYSGVRIATWSSNRLADFATIAGDMKTVVQCSEQPRILIMWPNAMWVLNRTRAARLCTWRRRLVRRIRSPRRPSTCRCSRPRRSSRCSRCRSRVPNPVFMEVECTASQQYISRCMGKERHASP